MPLAGYRILIVEDEPLVAIDYADEFEGRGALPHVAGTLHEAINAVSSQIPDLAVLDVNLGLEFVWPVARTLSMHKVPFFLVTASPTHDLPPDVCPEACLAKPVAAYAIADQLIEVVLRKFA